MNYKEAPFVDMGEVQLEALDQDDGVFSLIVDTEYGTCTHLDALHIYERLKDYFKGTEYE